MQTQECKGCGVAKALSNFPIRGRSHKKNRANRSPYCTTCTARNARSAYLNGGGMNA